MELGISPIVTSGLIMQVEIIAQIGLLNGSDEFGTHGNFINIQTTHVKHG